MKYLLIMYDKEMFERKELKVNSEKEAKDLFDTHNKYKFGFFCTIEHNIINKYAKE
ncbi:MAG: hypothetical protein NC222_06980 [Staphylococcus sp.]|nr:hypothetical protein [Staphylococcus sp.]